MIGVDIVLIDRIDASIKRYGRKFLARFLSNQEIDMVKKSQTAAGFWAAKEAVAKALGTGIGNELGFYDILIQKDKKGAPFFILSSKIVEKYNITSTSLSIAHDGGFAIAVVAIETSSSSNKVQ